MYSTDIVKDNIYLSATHNRLELKEIAILQRSVPPLVDLRRLKKSESLKVLLEKKPEKTRIVAYKYSSGRNSYIGYRISDSQFYSINNMEDIPNLVYPVPPTAKMSSPFNLSRLNPVSGRVSPHKGIDYSMPLNTQVVSVLNGRVSKAEYNNTMGYFVEVISNTRIKTRYLHLNKILVKAGDQVSRGKKIALSGNSGRSSGPHLHYELLVNNRPVNSLFFRTEKSGSTSLDKHVLMHARAYEQYLD
ncbi:peptidoglycan DD-metalloendopeptidase family protein [Enterobacter ludwigii]|uniref:peptidoglycan DD-metalloendopeptidase family protein n=1 Tax=Enterobacter ludwigii TaxID=299767 RepID=UPI001C8BF5E1|nr:peptidoglycan DD-metalloendopeptidase family protein [Enterobacter ludwigii]EKS6730699.1 peptidoglycan DD-metalloendopeptidase family protein [Enterobacter mori]MBX8911065.1 peptidoglycan DD-metalloendopeptidase family protein [Enterobacter ludwigii]MCM7781939.1 peptidoglycan DD-metalloendopeptidase family protein [Enterobacter ludwigii]